MFSIMVWLLMLTFSLFLCVIAVFFMFMLFAFLVVPVTEAWEDIKGRFRK